MTAATCRTCRSAPVACEGLCVVCLRDKLAADRERRNRQERHQRGHRRRKRDDGKAYFGAQHEARLQDRSHPAPPLRPRRLAP